MNGSLAGEKILSWLLVAAAAVYLALFMFNSLTRTGRFSPDSMNYVNVAQNILSGKGLTQPTVGYIQESFSLEDKAPIPFVRQPPLYPIMIAAVSKLGISPARSALFLSAIANVAILCLIFGLARTLYDDRVAMITATLALFYFPLQWITGWAWTEPISIALLLASIWLLAAKSESRAFIFVAGLLAGTAFTTRWALAPIIGVGILFLLLRRNSRRSKIFDLALYTIGFVLPAGAVMLRNYLVAGVPFATQRPITGFLQNLSEVFATTFGVIWTEPATTLQIALFLLSVLAICIVLALRHDFLSGVREVFVADRRSILPLWSAAYLVFLIAERSFNYVEVDARIISPATPTLLMLWSALAVRASRLSILAAKSFALVLLLIATWQQSRAAIQTQPFDFARTIRESERLSWIEKYTTGKDLIIGVDVLDVPFFFHRTDTLSFASFPESDPADYGKIMAYARRYCRDYENIYLILQSLPPTEHDSRVLFGDFVTDLAFGHAGQYPGIVLREKLSDALVFQIDCR